MANNAHFSFPEVRLCTYKCVFINISHKIISGPFVSLVSGQRDGCMGLESLENIPSYVVKKCKNGRKNDNCKISG